MEDLIKSLRSREAIIFVGAGVSATLGLPTWSQLINEMAQILGFDPDVFNGLGDNYTLAEFFKIKKGGLGSLRSWMDTQWHDPKFDISKSEVHELIVQLKSRLIYTTNYDRWLEHAHEHHGVKFAKIVDVSDLPEISSEMVQIVKFHGDFDSDSSIVLAESDYFERLGFDTPLDIRFRADTLGRTVLFLGYRLSDINLRFLLYKLHRIWANSPYNAARPKSYVFMARPNVVDETILRERGITPIVGDSDDPGESLLAFLKKIHHDVYSTVY